MSRSVEAVVADMVEEAARGTAERRTHDELSAEQWAAYLADAQAGLVAAGVPALVEALAALLEATDPYIQDAAPHEELNGLWSQRFSVLADAQIYARQALGGEQVQGRQAGREWLTYRVVWLLGGSPCSTNGTASSDQAIQTAVLIAEQQDRASDIRIESRRHSESVTEFAVDEPAMKRLAGESSSPIPTTPKGAE